MGPTIASMTAGISWAEERHILCQSSRSDGDSESVTQQDSKCGASIITLPAKAGVQPYPPWLQSSEPDLWRAALVFVKRLRWEEFVGYVDLSGAIVMPETINWEIWEKLAAMMCGIGLLVSGIARQTEIWRRATLVPILQAVCLFVAKTRKRHRTRQGRRLIANSWVWPDLSKDAGTVSNVTAPMLKVTAKFFTRIAC